MTPKVIAKRPADVRQGLIRALSVLVAAGVAQEDVPTRQKLAPRGPEWNEALDSLQYALRHMPLAHLTLPLFWMLLAWDKKNATEKGRLNFASALACAVAALREEGV
jgi:hypothetical protein